ncbi:polysaccharide biosynthesis tyrosine autokinase [Botrimarina mediterranea]|uniref:polysaccharide biosynthesis tyrosine autokinase n=1 Tax=Botrimarina mediterranea TaxID=2528022 RepID=UPI00118802CE|nr:Tyrosine-protein kinase etk [Planctomycetes bacterium K2D]
MSDHTKTDETQLPIRRVDNGIVKHDAYHRHPRPVNNSGPAPSHFTPKFLLWVFSRSWKVVVPVGVLLAAATAAVLLYTYVPQFAASGLIKIEDIQPYVAFQQAAVGSNNGSFIRTQIELMRSPVVLREVLSDQRVGAASHLNKTPDRLSHLRRNLQIKQVGGSELYEVSYSAPSPQEASDVVGAVIQQYFARQSDEGYRRVQRVVDLLEKERTRRQLEVERLQTYVIDLSREVTGKDPFGQNVVDVEKAISPLASLHQQLTEIEVRIEILKAELQSIEETPIVTQTHEDRTGSIDLEVSMHAEVRQREQAILALESQMRQIQQLTKQWRENGSYKSLSDARKHARTELTEFKAALREQLLAARESDRQVGGQSVADHKREELASLEIQERTLRRRFEKELANVQEGGGKGAELEFAKAELAREEKVFELIAARKLALQTESKAPARVEVVDEVTASPVPLEAAPWKKLVLACGLAMAAPFGLAVLREASLRRVSDAEQLFEDTRLRILGEISTFPTRRVAANPRQIPRKLRKEMFAFAESIDALRMSLTFSADSEQQRIVAITSANSGEGKSSVSVALGMSFANATRRRTLIIDGDMRDPSVTDLLDVPAGPGLCEVLGGKLSLNEAIQPVPATEHLFVLRAGSCAGAPHHLAQPQRLQKLVEALRGDFRTIVIDTPPVLGASEALSLCRSADMTVVCARRGVSRIRQIKIASEKLENAGVSIVGSVLSGVPPRGYGYAYAYGYGYRDDTQEQIESDDAGRR